MEIAELHAKQQELRLLQKMQELRQQNGLAFYRPHKKQQAFHAAGQKKYRYARTGNRFGKSDMGSAEDVSWAVGARLWLSKTDPLRTLGIPQRPTKGLIICTDWDKSKEVFTDEKDGKLWKYLPKDCGARGYRNHSGAVDRIVLENGSSIHIDTVQSFKQNRMSQESSSWDYIHVDEPCPKEMFIAASRGLIDRGGSAWILCTPLDEIWINDFFIPSRRASAMADVIQVPQEKKWYITGSAYDNPYVSAEDIKDFEMTLTEDERNCRINGIPLAMAGMVYKEFSPDRHVLKEVPKGWADYDRPPKSYTIRRAIDPHPRKPIAVLMCATAPTGETIFFKEFYEQKSLIKEVCQGINAYSDGYFIFDSLIDPLANTENPIDGTTMKDEFLSNGVFVEEAIKDPTAGILKVRELLRDKNPVTGRENLYFSPELLQTLYEFDHFIWDKDTNKPKKKDDDMMECLYRLCLTGLEYVAPPSDGDYTIIKPIEITNVDLDIPDRSDSFNELDLEDMSPRQKRRKHYSDAY